MVLWLLRTILFAFATAGVGVCASLAQDANYASVAATPDIAGSTELPRLGAQEQLLAGSIADCPCHRGAQIGHAHRAPGRAYHQ